MTGLSPEESLQINASEGILYNTSGGNTFIRGMGGGIQTDLKPIVLSPTDAFHNCLHDYRKINGITGNKFPYILNDFDGCGPTKINVSIRRWSDLLIIKLQLDVLNIECDRDLLELRNLESHGIAYNLIDNIIWSMTSKDNIGTKRQNNPKIFPLVFIEPGMDCPPLELKSLLSILTGHLALNERVSNLVWQKNEDHNIDDTTVLIDQQGIVGYVPSTVDARQKASARARFINAAGMIEYAAILGRLMENKYLLPSGARTLIQCPTVAIPQSVSCRYMWKLFVKEFGLDDKLVMIDKTQSMATHKKILIYTVTEIETKAVMAAFDDLSPKEKRVIQVEDFYGQYLGEIGCNKLYLGISGMGTGGMVGSQESIRRGIKAIQPDAVIMVGIAFGADKSKQKIGNILVARQVILYEPQRINSDGSLTSRGDKVTASPSLLEWAIHSKFIWGEMDSERIEFGPVLTGEKLIDNTNFRDALLDKEKGAIGGEMEGAGLYVACQSDGVDWLLVKSICDWADGNKSRNKKANQTLAAKNAAGFVSHMIRSRSLTS